METTMLCKFSVKCLPSRRLRIQDIQRIQLKGSIPALKEGIPLVEAQERIWTSKVLPVSEIEKGFTYKYVVFEVNDNCPKEEVRERKFKLPALGDFVKTPTLVDIQDEFRDPSEPSSLTYTSLFKKILFSRDHTPCDSESKAALVAGSDSYVISLAVHYDTVPRGWQVCIVGDHPSLGGWDVKKSKPLQWDEDRQLWVGEIAVSKSDLPLQYKAIVCDEKFEHEKWEYIERQGNLENREITPDICARNPGESLLFRTNEFRYSPSWKGAGIVIPVFSLRSEKSLGIGEFLDLKLLVQWASKCGFCLIQLLPVNDSDEDPSPYSTISAFALHPVYIRLESVWDKNWKTNEEGDFNEYLKTLEADRQKLKPSEGTSDHYLEVLKLKMTRLHDIFDKKRELICSENGFKEFVQKNKEWLYPYAAFRALKDFYKTPDYRNWNKHVTMSIADIEEKRVAEDVAFRDESDFWMFVQYHLHLQLLEAKTFGDKHKVGIKGDLPIGVGRFSTDTWMHPGLFRLHKSAGAPPDPYSAMGQNWGFPSYNWAAIEIDKYSWWRDRLRQMERYFCAFRIDHALGFFRIWEIPANNVTAMLGQFFHCKPVTAAELKEAGFHDINRLLDPYITKKILADVAGDDVDYITSKFLTVKSPGAYAFCPEGLNEAGIKKALEDDETLSGERRQDLQRKVFELYHNLIIIPDQSSNEFQFRFGMTGTKSFEAFKALPGDVHKKLEALYNNWLRVRQDPDWSKAAVKKLQALQSATSMLVCGEDLGDVPGCAHPTLNNLGIVGLRIMPWSCQDGRKVNVCAEYEDLTICSSTCHDMPPLRLWYQTEAAVDYEKKDASKFKNAQQELCKVLGLNEMPPTATPKLCEEVLRHHVNSPSVLTMIPLQDVFAINDGEFRSPNIRSEQINSPKGKDDVINWAYRMHVTLEKLNENDGFIKQVAAILRSGNRITDPDPPSVSSKPQPPIAAGPSSGPLMFVSAPGTRSA